jgi:hypothetical protein
MRVLQAQKICFDTRDSVLKLWVHECLRVFSDRFLQVIVPGSCCMHHRVIGCAS